MNGQTDSGDRWAVEQLEARFGASQTARLMAAWQENWITTRDLDKIQQAGFTLLRVPFGYRNLQDASGKWLLNADGKIDFSRFDWIVNEAAKRNLYVVLCFHVWQGQRENYGTISRVSAASDVARINAAAIWTQVAQHFAGNGTIAGFDIVNEPEGSPDDVLQKTLYQAVRSQDPERIVINESSDYRNYSNPYWKNVVWSAHYPVKTGGGTSEAQIRQWEINVGIADHPEITVPIYLGEIKAPNDDITSARELSAALDSRGYSWSVWTYKGVNIGGWAGFNYYSDFRYNLATDSYNSLLDKWSKGLIRWQSSAAPTSQYDNQWWFDGFK